MFNSSDFVSAIIFTVNLKKYTIFSTFKLWKKAFSRLLMLSYKHIFSKPSPCAETLSFKENQLLMTCSTEVADLS